MLPPPRARTRTSSGFQASLGALSSRIAVAISSAAPVPCTRTGLISTSTPGARRRRMLRMSWMAAPLGEVTIPMRRGNFGRARLRRIEKSFRFQFSLQRFEFRLEQAEPARLQNLDAELILPARFEDGDVAVNLHLHAVGQRGRKGRKRVAKNHASDRRPLIFEREILVARTDVSCSWKFRPAPRPRRNASRAGREWSASVRRPSEPWRRSEKDRFRIHVRRCGKSGERGASNAGDGDCHREASHSLRRLKKFSASRRQLRDARALPGVLRAARILTNRTARSADLPALSIPVFGRR